MSNTDALKNVEILVILEGTDATTACSLQYDDNTWIIYCRARYCYTWEDIVFNA